MAIASLFDNRTMIDGVLLVARAALSSPFLYSGVDKLWRWSAAEEEVTASGLPLPTVLHVITVILQLGAGLSLLLGIETRLGAVALILFLLPVTVIYHPFWRLSGGRFFAETDHFLGNLAIIGGLLLLVAFGAGRFSLLGG